LLRERMLGVLHIGAAQPHHFTEADVRFLQRAADRIALAIDRASAYEAERVARQEAEAALAAVRASEERLRLFVENVPAAVAMLDGELRYLSASRRWRQFYQFDEGYLGRCHYDLFPEVPERWKAIHRRCLAGAVESSDEDRFERRDGSTQWLKWEVRPWYTQPGEVGGILIFSEDLTERMRLGQEREEARANELASREVNRHMDEFLATAAHDLRQPVTGAVMGIGLAQRRLQRLAAAAAPNPVVGERPAGPQDEARATSDALERASEAADRMSRMVNRLFDVAQAQSGTLELKPVACDLAALVREQVEIQRVAISHRTVRLGKPPKRSVPVVADGDRLGQVLANYLTNALKYSPPDRPVAVTLAVRQRQARVAVRDEGPGLPPEEQTRVWEPFHRAPGIRVQNAVGESLGLGLHICKTIVEAHGGTVGVESEVGAGSTFWFSLPLALHDKTGDGTSATPLS
jgi:PAS domain S-box-containing protein